MKQAGTDPHWPMKGWMLVEPEGVEDDDQLKDWIQRAVQFVGTLLAN